MIQHARLITQEESIDPVAKRMWKTTARVSAIGLEMAIAIVIGYGIGWWLDRRYETKPRYMVIFLLVGVAAGFRGLIRVVQEERARQRRASKSQTEDRD